MYITPMENCKCFIVLLTLLLLTISHLVDCHNELRHYIYS